MTRSLVGAPAAVLLAALTLAGCGGNDDRRAAFNRYVASVNATQAVAVAEWNTTRTAYASVGRRRLTDRQLRNLATAPTTIRALRQRLAAVRPPEDARRLRARLLRLLDLQASFAAEVSMFAHYVAAVSPLQQRVADETTRLRRGLQASHARGPEQRALTTYAERLDRILTTLRRLGPPRALAPWHAEQVARVTRLRDGALSAARGLERQDRSEVGRGVAMLTGAATAAPVTVADRAAIVAYNARLTRIREAAGAVAREQTRLTLELA